MKKLLLFISLVSFSAIGQIDYTVTILRLKALADPCDGGLSPLCPNAPQDPVFHVWSTDAEANENTNCWAYDNDDDAAYNTWIDIQNVEIANETNVLTSYIQIDMGGFESDVLIGAPDCDDWSGDEVMNRQLAQQFDVSTIAEGVPYITTVDIGDIYYAEIEIVWIDPFASTKELDQKFNFRLAPNPTEGIFHLVVAEDENQAYNMTVVDLSGRTVLQKNDVTTQTSIDLTGNEAGAYIVYVEYGGRTKPITLMLK